MIRMITFVLVLAGNINAGLAQTQTDFHQLVIPDNGIWWNPDMPGTGASMQFSEAGPWLVILFTYDSEGNPVFYTLQDDQLDLSLTRTSFGTETGPNGLRAYARGVSPVRISSGGQCIGCDPQLPQTGELLPGVEAELIFHDMDTALIRFSGAIEFEEWLTPFVPQGTVVSGSFDPYQPGLKTVSFIGQQGPEQAVALEGGICFTGLCNVGFICVTGCNEPAGRLVERINYIEAVFEPRGAINVLQSDIAYPYLTFRSYVTRRLVAIIDPGSPSPDSLPHQIVIRPVHK